MGRDRWAEWILERRFGGNAEAAAAMLGSLAKVRERVLDRAEIQPGETVLDVGCGDGLIAFGALERVGTDGRVIFSDVSRDLLDVARELAEGDSRCEFVLAFEPINRFTYPEPEGVFLGIDAGEVWPLARRLRDRYERMAGDDSPMVDFDERDLLELAHSAGFARIDVELEARIERGRLWGGEPPPLEQLLKSAPNPNAPTFEEVLAAELSAEERERFLAYVKPRYDAGEMTGRSAVAYLRARKLHDP